jgi:hypothetical protein
LFGRDELVQTDQAILGNVTHQLGDELLAGGSVCRPRPYVGRGHHRGSRNGMGCNQDGYAELQTFLIRYDKESKTYSQSKLSDPSQYVIRDESTVPPGDCVIVEFDMLKSRTDKLCQQYGIRDETRCVEFGVSSYNPKLCNIRESDVTPFRDAVDKIYEQEAL